QHPIPAVTLGKMETGFAVRGPLPVENRSGILPLEIGTYSLLKCPPEHHGCPGIFLLPAIEVAMFVAARAGQILADLGVAVHHEDASDPRPSLLVKTESSSQRAAGAKPSKFR